MNEKNDTILSDLIEIIDAIQQGENPKSLPKSVDCESDNTLLNQLSEKINTLKEQYANSYQFILSLASGKLESEPPCKISFINPYKQLHSELRHLTWQIQQIAEGNYDQHVSFSGDFSEAINKMIEALHERQKLIDIIKDDKERLYKSEQELKEANQAKDKLFSIIAHDLKSPFHSLMGLSEILLDEVSQGSFENVTNYVSIFNKSVNRTYDLIVNLLQWARLQSEKITPNYKSFNLNELVAKNLETANISAVPKNIQLLFEAKDDYTAFSDEEIISTVLRNLLSNAIKYTYSGGQITVTIQAETNCYLISVTDTGTGIEKGKIDKIFSIEEVSVPGTNNEKGTGLGLTICKEFISKIGGNIWVESTYGVGSTFTFSIPNT